MKNSKSLVVSCILTVVLALSMAGTASADNLLANADFESGDLTGWFVYGETPNSGVTVQTPDNGPSGAGTHNAYMDNSVEGLGLTLKASSEAGSGIAGSVIYSYDLMLDSADAGGVLFVEIFAEQAGGGVIGSSGLMGPLWPWGAWTNYTGSFVAPAGTDFLTIQIMANTGANAGANCRAHVDNVVLDQGTVAVQSENWDSIKALYR